MLLLPMELHQALVASLVVHCFSCILRGPSGCEYKEDQSGDDESEEEYDAEYCEGVGDWDEED